VPTEPPDERDEPGLDVLGCLEGLGLEVFGCLDGLGLEVLGCLDGAGLDVFGCLDGAGLTLVGREEPGLTDPEGLVVFGLLAF
jgi:hypothetical protein